MPSKNKSKQPQQARPQQVSVQQTTAFQGPIPAPDDLMRYEQITPGLADRIMSMAENEAEHRQQQERELLSVNGKLANRQQNEVVIGQIFGLVIGLSVVGTSAWLAVNGYQLTGGLVGSAGVIGLVSVFVIGRKTNS